MRPTVNNVNYFNLYSLKIEKLDTARSILQHVLKMDFLMHDSLYFGVYYMAKDSYGTKISIKWNFNPEEEEYLEPDFKDEKILVYVDNASLDTANMYNEKLLEDERIKILRQKRI